MVHLGCTRHTKCPDMLAFYSGTLVYLWQGMYTIIEICTRRALCVNDLKQITRHVSCSVCLSLLFVPCSYGRVACSARSYVHKAYTLGVLGAIRCYVVDVWPTFLYGIAVSRSSDSNRGRFHSSGGVNAPLNTLVHICRHYGVSTDVLRQSRVYFFRNTRIYMVAYGCICSYIQK